MHSDAFIVVENMRNFNAQTSEGTRASIVNSADCFIAKLRIPMLNYNPTPRIQLSVRPALVSKGREGRSQEAWKTSN